MKERVSDSGAKETHRFRRKDLWRNRGLKKRREETFRRSLEGLLGDKNSV